MPKLELLDIDCGLWRLQDDGVNAYAIAANDRALLIDPLPAWKRAHLRTLCAAVAETILLTRPSKDRFLACAHWKAPIHLSGLSRPLWDNAFLEERKNPPQELPVSPFYDPPKKPRRAQSLISTRAPISSGRGRPFDSMQHLAILPPRSQSSSHPDQISLHSLARQ